MRKGSAMREYYEGRDFLEGVLCRSATREGSTMREYNEGREWYEGVL